MGTARHVSHPGSGRGPGCGLLVHTPRLGGRLGGWERFLLFVPGMRTTLLLLLTSLALGCQGQIEEPWRPGPPAPLDCSEPSQAGAPVPTRRLTAPQLEASVRDVFDLGVTYPLSDEELLGYRANVSGGLDTTGARSVMTAAEEISVEVAPLVAADVACGRETCADHVLDTYGERLFRRPLDGDTRARFASLYALGYAEGGAEEGVRWMLEAMLQSPRFLYQVELSGADGRLDGYTMASRLSYALWGGPPDRALLDAAARGDLDTADGLRAEAGRMIDDPRFERGLEEFVVQWLELEELDDVLDRPDLEELDPATVYWLRQEPVAFVAEHVRRGSDLVELLTSPETIDVPALHPIYGDDIVSVDIEGNLTVLDPDRRAGILTLPGVQAALAHARQTSPTLRGRAVLANLLCNPPPPPPAGVVPSLPPAMPGATTRERLSMHFESDACAGCHAAMDGIGFAFEHYDHFGRWRETDNGHPVDATSEFDLGYDPISVDGGPEMSAALAERREVAECVARHWARFGSGVMESNELACTIASMADAAQSEGGLRAMILEYVSSPWFRKPAQTEEL